MQVHRFAIRPGLLIYPVLSIFFVNCHQDFLDDTPNIFDPPDKYLGCCDSLPIDFDTLGMQIFIPNAISPNGDGINDDFSIFSSVPMRILTLEVKEVNEILGIKRTRINIEGLTPLWQPINTSGQFEHGMFEYDIVIHNFQGDTLHVKGTFCSLDCTDEKTMDIHIPSCVFASNINESGRIDSSTFYVENDCSY